MNNSVAEIERTNAMFVIGSNTTENHPIIALRMKKAVQNGAKLIVADPRKIPLVKFAHLWLRHKPGTDIALINSMMHVILKDGLEDKEFIDNYIQFAKDCGAKVAFRKYFNNLNTLTEIDTDDTLEGEHSCGACLHRWHTIDGVNVTFKYSVKETFEHVDGIYELILQSNGDLTYDWNGNNKLTYKGD